MEEIRTIEVLRNLQKMNLESKIMLTKKRIRDFYLLMDGNVYISFSGGKDSTVLLHIARTMYPNIKAVFDDTGLEYPEIREHVERFDNVEYLKPQKNFRRVVIENGYPIASKNISKFINAYRRGVPYAAQYFNREKTDSKGRISRFCIAKRWQKLGNAPFMVSSECCDISKLQMSRNTRRQGNQSLK